MKNYKKEDIAKKLVTYLKCKGYIRVYYDVFFVEEFCRKADITRKEFFIVSKATDANSDKNYNQILRRILNTLNISLDELMEFEPKNPIYKVQMSQEEFDAIREVLDDLQTYAKNEGTDPIITTVYKLQDKLNSLTIKKELQC